MRAYREAMAEFAQMGTMDIWYAHLSRGRAAGRRSQDAAAAEAGRRTKDARSKDGQGGKDEKGRSRRRPARTTRGGAGGGQSGRRRRCAKAHTRDSLQALSKLGELVDGHYRIVSQPPIVVPARDLAATYGMSAGRGRARRSTSSSAPTGPPCRTTGGTCWSGSRSSTWPARSSASAASAPGRSSCCCRAATRRTRCSCRSRRPPASVLEDHLPQEPVPAARRAGGAGAADDAGRQRHLPGLDQGRARSNRHFYWRQLRDMKGSALVETMTAGRARRSTPGLCGWTLARAHARSGDPVAIAEYLGDDDAFDRSITDFSERYADQNEQDYQAVRRTRSDPGGWKRSRASDDPVGLAAGRRRGEEGALSSWSMAILASLPGASHGASSAGRVVVVHDREESTWGSADRGWTSRLDRARSAQANDQS